ncbi:unnamed protein product [Acanthosepion pharaonis]|uniref:Uncharacterized protein n=1 Tax=Acanthosepion pharaonis TaxID=158019 RepID=A0A812BK67_ACAPH|nr:unnamed protein product [Sepia pharaonis]
MLFYHMKSSEEMITKSLQLTATLVYYLSIEKPTNMMRGLMTYTVTLAVPITASLSICCIRCNERRKAPRNGRLKISKKKLDQQRHLIVHPHLATAWSEVAIVRYYISDVQRELKSAKTDSEDGWSDAELKAAQQLKDLSSSDYIEPHSSDKDQISSRCEASSQEPLLFSVDSGFNTPYGIVPFPEAAAVYRYLENVSI